MPVLPASTGFKDALVIRDFYFWRHLKSEQGLISFIHKEKSIKRLDLA
jgi:hypothetical protein